ncbi:MAG TPA: DNA polymerase III subunit delta' [Actinomycetes bacterium]|nr:DNA polymerase III subunit delta' [Actinomycetes bacterium]
MSVFDRLVGQPHVVRVLEQAVAGAQDSLAGGPGHGMTQAWLFTGPPGSGRSTAARAFAAALQCTAGGCGTCHDCVTGLKGTHADVTVASTMALSIGVDAARELGMDAAAMPSGGRWRVLVVEDADRLTDAANNALLKQLEEPTPHAVWLLSVPTAEDVLPTIRSRCRVVSLTTPSTEAVARYLVDEDGIDPAMAAFAARASQGHIGRARGLATDESTRLQRSMVLELPTHLGDLRSLLAAAGELVGAATERANEQVKARDGGERRELARALGVPNANNPPPWARPQFTQLRDAQKKRAKRSLRDQLDRSLLDLLSLYRDVLVLQLGADVPPVNGELGPALQRLASSSTPEETVDRMDAIGRAREQLGSNANPLLTVENLMIGLHAP